MSFKDSEIIKYISNKINETPTLAEGLEERIEDFYQACGSDDELAQAVILEIHKNMPQALEEAGRVGYDHIAWARALEQSLAERLVDYVSTEQIIAFLGIWGMYPTSAEE